MLEITELTAPEVSQSESQSQSEPASQRDNQPSPRRKRNASAARSAAAGNPKKVTGGRNYQPKGVQDLANAIASGLRGSTVAAVWALDLDEVRFPDGQSGAELVMRRTEAQAIAQPLSRILWKHRADWVVIQWLLKLIERTESQSDLVALLVASYAYGSRIADMALFSYAMKSQEAAAARAARAVGSGNGGKPAQQARPTQQPAGRAPAQPAQPAVVGPDGIGERISWNGGPFGATLDQLVTFAPGLDEPIQPGDWLGG